VLSKVKTDESQTNGDWVDRGSIGQTLDFKHIRNADNQAVKTFKFTEEFSC
jgi:hypothetical protein